MKRWQDQLGLMVSELYRLGILNEGLHEDISLWSAPSECHTLISRSYDTAVQKELDRLFQLYGIRSMEELHKEWSRRVEGYRAYCISCFVFCNGEWDAYDRRYRVETA